MRVLLVTFSECLPFALTQMLNPALEYCAIVVDEPDISKKMFENFPQLCEKIFPFYELKECIQNNYYEFVLCISDSRMIDAEFPDKLKSFGVNANNMVHINSINTATDFMLETSLRYYQKNTEKFSIFTTGISYTQSALLTDIFKFKLFNFGNGSQDLYYDYQIAKFILEVCRGGHIKYALIGLAPYSFHYDLSKAFSINFRLFKYAVAFKDLHNFWLSSERYLNIFRKEFPDIKLPVEKMSLNNFCSFSGGQIQTMDFKSRLNMRNMIDDWKDKNYPDSVKENVRILDDYLTLCEKNNVRPIMFIPQMTEACKKYFNQKLLNEFYYLVREAQKKHSSAIFFDGWKLQGFTDADFSDATHLNVQGGMKFSSILNNFIESLEKG